MLLLAGTQQEKVELALAAGAEFLCEGPGDRRQLPLYPIPWQYSPILPPPCSIPRPFQSPTPTPPHPSHLHSIPPFLLLLPFSPDIDFSLLGFLKKVI